MARLYGFRDPAVMHTDTRTEAPAAAAVAAEDANAYQMRPQPTLIFSPVPSLSQHLLRRWPTQREEKKDQERNQKRGGHNRAALYRRDPEGRIALCRCVIHTPLDTHPRQNRQTFQENLEKHIPDRRDLRWSAAPSSSSTGRGPTILDSGRQAQRILSRMAHHKQRATGQQRARPTRKSE